jgi:hypothetical protein
MAARSPTAPTTFEPKPNQANLAKMTQLELFADSPASAVSTVPTQGFVRARLDSILDPLRRASTLPWSARELAKFRVIVPQMANWLPPDERDAVRREFTSLVETLLAPPN